MDFILVLISFNSEISISDIVLVVTCCIGVWYAWEARVMNKMIKKQLMIQVEMSQ